MLAAMTGEAGQRRGRRGKCGDDRCLMIGDNEATEE